MTRIRHTPRYGFFSKEKILPNLALLIVIAAGIFYAFYEDVLYLKILSWIVIAILATIVLTRITLEVLLYKYPGVVNIVNEILYLLIGLPYLIIAGMFLPYSIYVLFFHPDNTLVTIVFLSVAAVIELAAIVYVIRQALRDKEMTLGEYLQYIFNFKRHVKEAELVKERAKEIEEFYDRLEEAKARTQAKLKERAKGFEKFDWHERLEELKEETVEKVSCWNCHALNPVNAKRCSKCGVSLKIITQKEQEQEDDRPKVAIRIDYSDQIPPITKHVILLIIGAVLFSIHAVITIFDFVQRQYWINSEVLEYITFAIMALGLFPIGLGIRWITEDYFQDYVTKRGRITQELFYAYAIAVIFNLILLGFPAMASMAAVFVLVGRIIGFYMLYRTFDRIKLETYLSVGGLIYWLYAFYSLIVAAFYQIAAFGRDDEMQIWILVFDGIIDSFLAIILAIKLIIDGMKIREYILEKNLQPRGFEDSWIFKDKLAKGEIEVQT